MRKAYKPPENLSIETVPPILWLFTLAALAVLIISGAILIVLLGSGLSDPPRAGSLNWQAKNADDWLPAKESGDLRFYISPTALPSLPFTLELTASNEGVSDSAWGIWGETWSILISHEGYFSIGEANKPHWAEFLHIRQDGDNKLYLNIQKDGSATLRINDEIAWTGILSISEKAQWGIVYYRRPTLTWKSIEIYA